MPVAKDDYLHRMQSFENALTVDSIKTKSLTEIVHNDIARLLRNGLAVVAFAALEDFIKNRTSEILSEIGKSTVKFEELPEALRYAATFKAVSALNFQISLRENEDKVAYVQDQALKIASTATNPYEITPHAFGFGQPNVSHETVKDILKALFVKNDPWGNVTELSNKIGLTALPLKDAFENATRRRHRAAHVASSNIPELDLRSFVNESYGIALSFDVFVSEALKQIQRRSMKHLSGTQGLSEGDIRFRFIRFKDGRWRELREGKTRAHRTATELGTLLPDARLRASHENEYLVVFGDNGQLKNWFV